MVEGWGGGGRERERERTQIDGAAATSGTTMYVPWVCLTTTCAHSAFVGGGICARTISNTKQSRTVTSPYSPVLTTLGSLCILQIVGYTVAHYKLQLLKNLRVKVRGGGGIA